MCSDHVRAADEDINNTHTMNASVAAPATTGSSSSRAKKKRAIHKKSEREKLKRDHFNHLFLILANSLGLNGQSNGKASILTEAARLLKDFAAQKECFKKENMSLSSELHYVTVEKNELLEENSSLESQIEKLQREIQAKTSQYPNHLNHLPAAGASLHLDQSLPTVLVVPLHPNNIIGYSEHMISEPASNISKPQARYPTTSDSWPSRLLGELDEPTSN
ncbi:hypothetical protein ACFE04_011639 [Oxalis oulophora]